MAVPGRWKPSEPRAGLPRPFESCDEKGNVDEELSCERLVNGGGFLFGEEVGELPQGEAPTGSSVSWMDAL